MLNEIHSGRIEKINETEVLAILGVNNLKGIKSSDLSKYNIVELYGKFYMYDDNCKCNDMNKYNIDFLSSYKSPIRNERDYVISCEKQDLNNKLKNIIKEYDF